MQDSNHFFFFVSQSGLEIMEAVGGHNPLTNMIANAVAAHIKVYGDGSKRIVQMLHFFLSRLCKSTLSSHGTQTTRQRCNFIRQIQGLKSTLVPTLLQMGSYR